MAAIADSRLLAPARLSALRHYGVLDTPREKDYDDLAELAAGICGTPYAVINFVDGARQWLKAEIGFGLRESPLESSICAQVMLESTLVEIADLQHDPRFTGNALVDIGMPGIGGHGLARQLRLAHPSSETLTLVALTGWGQRQDIERSKAAGFDHHLVKPVALEEILALMV